MALHIAQQQTNLNVTLGGVLGLLIEVGSIGGFFGFFGDYTAGIIGKGVGLALGIGVDPQFDGVNIRGVGGKGVEPVGVPSNNVVIPHFYVHIDVVGIIGGPNLRGGFGIGIKGNAVGFFVRLQFYIVIVVVIGDGFLIVLGQIPNVQVAVHAEFVGNAQIGGGGNVSHDAAADNIHFVGVVGVVVVFDVVHQQRDGGGVTAEQVTFDFKGGRKQHARNPQSVCRCHGKAVVAACPKGACVRQDFAACDVPVIGIVVFGVIHRLQQLVVVGEGCGQRADFGLLIQKVDVYQKDVTFFPF